MSAASHSDELLGEGGSLPAFVEREIEVARCHAALARAGYRRVKATYAKQLRTGPDTDTFHGLERENLWPTMDFVRAWLKAEKKRIHARVRWTFFGAMLATIVTGLTFTAAFSIFR